MQRSVQVILLAGTSIVIATAAWAAAPQATTSSLTSFVPPVLVPLVGSALAAPAEAGMLAFLDPETHTLRAPNAIESQQEGLPAIVDWQSQVVETSAWDGSPMIDLKGYMQDYAILQIASDGSRVMRCVPDPKAALKAAVAPAAKPVEE